MAVKCCYPVEYFRHAWDSTNTQSGKLCVILFYIFVWMNILGCISDNLWPTKLGKASCHLQGMDDDDIAASIITCLVQQLHSLIVGFLLYAHVGGIRVWNVVVVFLFYCAFGITVLTLTNVFPTLEGAPEECPINDWREEFSFTLVWIALVVLTSATEDAAAADADSSRPNHHRRNRNTTTHNSTLVSACCKHNNPIGRARQEWNAAKTMNGKCCSVLFFSFLWISTALSLIVMIWPGTIMGTKYKKFYRKHVLSEYMAFYVTTLTRQVALFAVGFLWMAHRGGIRVWNVTMVFVFSVAVWGWLLVISDTAPLRRCNDNNNVIKILCAIAIWNGVALFFAILDKCQCFGGSHATTTGPATTKTIGESTPLVTTA